ncbi:MAG: DUF456 domain-containing protein [Deltaproteobacteria bacterium]
MDYVIFALFILIAAAGLISHVFGLPGNFIILGASILYGWYGGFGEITVKIIIILVALAVLAEVIEFILGILGAKKYKSSNKAVVGSIIFGIIGGVLGIPFFFGIGAVIGAFIGAFVGAFIIELLLEKNFDRAVKSGQGALLGRVGGAISKGAIGLTMIAITIVSVVRN